METDEKDGQFPKPGIAADKVTWPDLKQGSLLFGVCPACSQQDRQHHGTLSANEVTWPVIKQSNYKQNRPSEGGLLFIFLFEFLR